MNHNEAIRIASESLPNDDLARAAWAKELEKKYADFCKGKRDWEDWESNSKNLVQE